MCDVTILLEIVLMNIFVCLMTTTFQVDTDDEWSNIRSKGKRVLARLSYRCFKSSITWLYSNYGRLVGEKC